MSGLVGSAVSATARIVDLLLQPAVPALALALTSSYPAQLISHLANSASLQSRLQAPGLRTGLLGLLIVGAVRLVNRRLNVLALNNYRAPALDEWKWSSEVAVVTGGANGIGKAIVVGLAEKGVKVAILDKAPLTEDLAAIENVHYWNCDISSESAVQEAAGAIKETIGHPSILVNNAGIGFDHSVLETKYEDLQRLFGVNILSNWLTTKEFLPSMVSQNKGHVITVASFSSYVPLARSVDYSATKAGLLAFHQGLSSEIKHVYKAPGIMTTIVHPMWVETAMTKKRQAKSEKARRSMMKPEDVSSKVLEQIFSCRSGHIILPEGVTVLTGFLGFPFWLQVRIRDFAAKGR